MPSTYSPSLRLELMATGENRSTWGSKANIVFSMIEDAVAGHVSIDMADANVTLTAMDGVEDQARYANISFTGANTAVRTVTIPTVPKRYVMRNATTGGFGVTISNGSSTGTLTTDQWHLVWTDGTTIFVSVALNGTYQPLDATLTALAALDATAGVLVQSGADTFVRRTLTGTANEVDIDDGDGVAGNPTFSLPDALTFTGKTITGGTYTDATFSGTTITGTAISGTTADFSSTVTGSSIITEANFSRETAGTLNFRPSGNGSTTGQMTLSTGGVLTATSFAGDGGSLTGLSAAQLTSGTLPDARLTGSYTGLTSVTGSGTATFASFSGSGASLTGLSATQISSGTLASARISGSYTGITAVGSLTSLTTTGTFTFASTVQSSGTTAIFATTGAGTIYLRPNGAGSATGQATVTSGGVLNATAVTESGVGLVRETISVTAGNGLSGGGTLAASRTLTVGAGTGISVASTSVSVDSTVWRDGNPPTGSTGISTSSGAIAVTSDVWRDGNPPADSQLYPILAAASAGEVGTYALLRNTTASTFTVGQTTSGGNLEYADGSGNTNGTNASGTWRCMGYAPPLTSDVNGTTLWMRVS